MIIVTVRTLNEENNITPFILAYENIADKILVADGGSEDDTLASLALLTKHHDVDVRHFTERTEMENGYWRNNDADHINFLVDWAKEYEPDWIIHDDCDSRPNSMLCRHGRFFLEQTDKNVVMTCRVYLFGEDRHFPHMMHLKPVEADNYMTSLWAWRPSTGLWFDDLPPAYTVMLGEKIAGDLHETEEVLDLMPPYGLLHYTWEDEEQIAAKIKVYKESGLIPHQKHPLQFAGPLKPLPEWAHE